MGIEPEITPLLPQNFLKIQIPPLGYAEIMNNSTKRGGDTDMILVWVIILGNRENGFICV
jgi:hypothetical protein